MVTRQWIYHPLHALPYVFCCAVSISVMNTVYRCWLCSWKRAGCSHSTRSSTLSLGPGWVTDASPAVLCMPQLPRDRHKQLAAVASLVMLGSSLTCRGRITPHVWECLCSRVIHHMIFT